MRWWAVALPIWGVFSAQFLARAWTSWLGIPIHLAGLALARGSRQRTSWSGVSCISGVLERSRQCIGLAQEQRLLSSCFANVTK